MDKVIFLIEKSQYRREKVENLTRKELEDWVSEEGYDDDSAIVKIDANDYDSVDDALNGEVMWCDLDDYYVFVFGF